MNKRNPLMILAGAATILAVSMPPGAGLLISDAHARVGRPATPVSYAGVARRTTRRAVAVTAPAATAAAVAPAATTIVYTPTPGCVEIVDAYGRIAYRCN